jgi:uracil-DNA glycosylase
LLEILGLSLHEAKTDNPGLMRKCRVNSTSLEQLHAELEACTACARLVAWREEVGRVKRAAYRQQTYWAKPVPGFGDPNATIFLLGLAPGAHGSNRTGRMFTGDSSGNFLFPALHRAGLASQPNATARDDGMRLHDLFITAAGRCAPPENKPTPEELRTCRPWLEAELQFLPNLRVILGIGRIGHEAWLEVCGLRKSDFEFGHGLEHQLPDGRVLLDSYHVSQQNTQTGRLTATMFDAILERAKVLASQKHRKATEDQRKK